MVEAAVVLPILICLIVGTMMGALAIFTNTQIAMLTREGARYAAVHGGQWAAESGSPLTTSTSILNNAIMPLAPGINSSQLTLVGPTYANASQMPLYPNTLSPGNFIQNTVTITLMYQWKPLIIFPTLTLSSTSTMPVVY
jgi:hypothetical protein